MPAQSAKSRDHNDPLIHFVDLCINFSLLVIILSLFSINSQMVEKRKLARSSLQVAVSESRQLDGSAPLAAVKGATDSDGDGFSDAVENYVGTDPYRVCVPNGWPPDINNDGKVDSTDLNILKQHFFKPVTAATRRYDLNMSGKIDIFDVNLFSRYFNKKCADLFPTQTADTLKISLGNGVDPPPVGTVGQLYAGSNLAVRVFSQKLNRFLKSGETTLSYTGSLPPGLVINDTLDFIFGKPTAAGRYDFTIKAVSKPTGVLATKTASITINPAPPAPTCSGTMQLTLTPDQLVATSGQVNNVTATVSGLSGCGERDVLHFFIYTTAGKQYLGPRYLKDPPSITLTAPSTPYPYGYLVEVYLDKGGDAPAGGPYDLGPASAYLKVLEPPPQPVEHLAPSIWPTTGIVSNWPHPCEEYCSGYSEIDIDNSLGTPVYASLDGIVSYITSDPYLCGIGLAIENSQHRVRYCHLSSTSVPNGQNVTQGVQVATMGSSGIADHTHLHYAVRSPATIAYPWVPFQSIYNGAKIDSLTDTDPN